MCARTTLLSPVTTAKTALLKKRGKSRKSGLTARFCAPIYAAHAARKATTLRAVLHLWQNEISRLKRGLFDIVI
jgi:hypothetical protein